MTTMQILDTGSVPTPRLITPAVERVTAWHREHSMRQARAAFGAFPADEAGDAMGMPHEAAVESPAARPASTPSR